MDTTRKKPSRSRRPDSKPGQPEPVSSLPGRPQDIAIVGMSCRFPGAEDYEAFWREMVEKRSGIGPIPSDRWQWKECYGDEETRQSLKYGGFITDIDCFDAEFFGINSREAEKMDPQHRLLLETVWKTIEDAGYKAADFDGTNTGVFIGVSTRDYNFLELYEGVDIDAYSSLGMADTILTNRVSYLLNLKGPSEPVDTACSSALVAIHRAVQSIRNGECDSAFAGGVHILCHPFHTISFSKAGMLSPNGRCKTFDKEADGYIRGEGIGTILLKPLHQAVQDRDHIYAVIRDSFINHGGKARTITSPNVYSQAKVITTAFEKAQVTADQISYIEAHGTGTPLGDPVEIIGLKKAFKSLENGQPEKTAYCGLGTVKTNIGHLESAAGIAGIIKVLLALKYKCLPPLQNFEEVNPKIDLKDSPFYLVTEAKPWDRLKDRHEREIPRIAGVSSFGFGGVNAHIVLEEFTNDSSSSIPERATPHTIVLSARDRNRLQEYAGQLSRFLRHTHDTLRLQDIAFTLNEGRDLKPEKLTLRVSSTKELQEKLDAFISGRQTSDPEAHPSGDYSGANRIPLPTYPFEKKRFWFRKRASAVPAAPATLAVPQSPQGIAHETTQTMSVETTVQMRDHIVFGFPIFPTDSLLELVHQAFKAQFKSPCLQIDHFYITSALIALRERETLTRVSLTTEGQEHQCRILSKIEGIEEGFRENIHCKVRPHAEAGGKHVEFLSLLETYDTVLEAAEIYLENEFPKPAGPLFDEDRVYIGPFFRSIDTLYIRGSQAVSRLILSPEAMQRRSEFGLHPSILDSLLISAAAFASKIRGLKPGEVYIPFYIEQVTVFKEITDTRYWADIRIVKADDRFVSFDIQLLDDQQELVLRFKNLSDLKVRKESIREGFKFLQLDSAVPRAVPQVIPGKIVLKKKSVEDSGPVTDHEGDLRRLLAETLIIDPGKIASDAGFADLGLDSILGLEFLQKINRRFGVDLPGTILYEHSSLERLCGHLTSILPRRAGAPLIAPANDLPGHSSPETPSATPRRITLKPLVATQTEPVTTRPVETPQFEQPDRSAIRLAPTAFQKSSISGDDFAANGQSTPSAAGAGHFGPELKAMLAETLIIDPSKITDDTGFADLGLDSILGLEYLQKINKRFGIDLQGTILYEHSTIRSLQAHLESRLPTPKGLRPPTSPAVPITEPQETRPTERAPIPAKTIDQVDRTQEIAIIGVGLRFPGAQTLSQLWGILRNNECKITEVPENRWDSKKLLADGSIYCARGGFIDGAEEFDAGLFGVSPREAELTDPQLRKLLEVVWETFEDAGVSARVRGSRTGVYIGNCFNDYREALFASGNHDYQYIGVCNSSSTISNRVAYAFDLKGPSMTIDTACSSSLVAVDLAVEALRSGSCDLAIAGGVNINVSPTKYLCFCAMGAFSRKGVINPFDEEADGYIPGEGVATLLLKPRAKAERDGDHIYGLIKATSVNSGGKSSGPAVPNPDQEREVMIQAWKRAGLTRLDYLEAHGTGTKIGDPLEINAIREAIRRTGLTGALSLGTIKSNIGHTEAVAGVAGIIKVLLQLRNDYLAGQPNLRTLNRMIDLSGTRITIEKDGRPWHREGNAPRIAGVNSFGMGGTYAHVVIEEYPDSSRSRGAESPATEMRETLIFPLSARNGERLADLAGKLARHLTSDGASLPLRDLAHTLQIGRAALEERAAIIAGTRSDLMEKLDNLARDNVRNGVIRGNAKHPSETLPTFANERAQREALAQWIELEDLDNLAEGWVHGLEVDWNALPSSRHARKVPLPTYAFARKKFWIPRADVPAQDRPAAIHPMLDSNVSTLSQQKYKKAIGRHEFFVKDHLVLGRHILPGVAYLEMARAAGELATGGAIRRIESVAWQRPVDIGEQGRNLQIVLFPESERTGFEILDADGENPIIYSRGDLSGEAYDEEKRALPEIQARCNRRLSRDEIYRFFRDHGLDYGPSFQMLEDLVANDRECLGRLSSSVSIADVAKEFVLHPSLMDGALQACMGLMTTLKGLFLPSSIKALTIHRPVTGVCFSHVRLLEKTESALVFDVDLLDADGQVLMSFQRFEARALPGLESRKPSERLLFATHWIPKAREPEAKAGGILLIDRTSENLDQLRITTGQSVTHLLPGGPYEDEISRSSPQFILYRAEDDENLFLDVLKLCQSVARRKSSSIRLLFETTTANLHGQALGGLVKTIARELPNMHAKVLEIDDSVSPESLSRIRWSELRAGGLMVRYRDGIRLEEEPGACSHDAIEEEGDHTSGGIREGAVVLITGGAGGLAGILARYLRKKYKAKVALTGRTPLARLASSTLELLKDNDVIYLEGDIGSADDVGRIARETRKRFGCIHGIVHAAGSTRDSLLLAKTADEAGQVIAPKIRGTRLLDERTRKEPLEFFVLFSSIAGLLGNIGQADYAYANAYLDRFAAWRNDLARKGQRQGKTVSIAWPLWEDGGMRIGAETRTYMHATLGMEALRTDEGLEIFEDCLRASSDSVLVLKGIREKIERALKPGERKGGSKTRSVSGAEGSGKSPGLDASLFKPQVEQDAVRIVAEVLKVPEAEIDLREEMSAFGFDSITFTELTNKVNDAFGLNLSPAVMFEYQTIERLAEFLVTEEAEAVTRRYGTAPALRREPSHHTATRAGIEAEAIRIVADTLKVPEREIDVNEEMSTYGFDSITFTELTNKVNETFGLNLSPALMFEHSTIASLVDHLLNQEAVSPSVRGENLDPNRVARHPANGDTQTTPTSREPRASSRLRFRESDASDRPGRLSEPVAIIGMSGRMPGAKDLEEFWKNLEEMKDCIEEIPASRWDHKKYTCSRWGGFIRDIDRFDRGFFNISPHEAELMDPQQRIFLEEVWTTIADAGYKPRDLSGTRTGLYVGVSGMDYVHVLDDLGIEVEAHTSTGVAHSVLANRISYLLNIHGPSEAIDTACSSSLVAVKRAVESIKSGECELAIAGGVNVLLHPKLYIAFSKAGMLSQDGRCKTFDKAANGYVRGEGVGVILLKPLSKAERDGDRIHGLIRGAGENHGGHVSGLTVPNPNAQADLIVRAMTGAGVSPETVSYIETHGTGTNLGDPIEVNGLKKAFSRLSEQRGTILEPAFCGIGSVKTNIGHLESASGIAGILKVLLAMKHGKLPGTVHFTELNPHIDLRGTPFTIVERTSEWRPKGNVPRIAGVSSFGFGGTNAHVVLQEYDGTSFGSRPASGGDHLILLSARNEERLREYAGTMAAFIRSNRNGLSLPDLAFTLRVGREAMEERLGFIARTFDEVVGHLERFARGELVPEIVSANIRQKGDALKLFGDDDVMREAVRSWMLQGKLRKLLELWTNGLDVSWEKLPRDPGVRRVHLPPCPFSRQRYWPEARHKTSPAISQSVLHPLLDSNESTLGEQRFRKRLTRGDFFVRDHVIQGICILPGAATLEMARIAGSRATRQRINRIESVLWQQPIAVESRGREIDITIHRQEEKLTFEIQSGNAEPRKASCLGLLSHATLTPTAQNIGEIRARCSHEMTGSELYRRFSNHGLDYGPAFQVIQRIWAGSGECLGELLLPASLGEGNQDVELHPALLDGAFQSSLGITTRSTGMFLPFAVKDLRIHGGLCRHCFSHVRLREETDQARIYDIEILNDSGTLLVSIAGFEARRALGLEPRPGSRVELFEPQWIETGANAETEVEPIGAESVRTDLLVVGLGADQTLFPQIPTGARFLTNLDNLASALSERSPESIVFWTGSANPDFARILQSTQIVLSTPHPPTSLVFVTSDSNLAGRALSGFARTLEQEHPKLRCKLLILEQAQQDDFRCIARETSMPGREVMYRSGKRFERAMVPFAFSETAKPRLKNRGIYLITGGAGGLGRIFAGHLLETFSASVILTGRASEKDVAERLAPLKALGDLSYIEGDVTSEVDVQRIVAWTVKKHGRIDGIIHSAGVVRDSLIMKKSLGDAHLVISPKITGTLLLDAATRDQSLDFFVLFSSVAAVLGNIGQSDYAFANAFMDEFASHRQDLVRQGQRHGATLSIDWPLWKDGGMQVGGEVRTYLRNTLGMEELSTTEGIGVFEKAIGSGVSSLLVLKGNQEKIARILSAKQPRAGHEPIGCNETSQNLKAMLETRIKKIIAEILKVQDTELDLQEDIGNFGVDSILGMQIITTINDTLRVDLAPVVLLEYRTLAGIIDHLLTEFPGELSRSLTPQQPIIPGCPVMEQTQLEQQGPGVPEIQEPPLTPPPSLKAVPSTTFERPEPPSRFGRLLYKVFSATSKLAWDNKASGLENLPDGPAIYCSNHESHFDSVFVLMSLPPEIRQQLVIMSKKEHFESWLMRNTGLKMITAVPVDREGDVLQSVEIGKSVIAGGRSLFLHPEGTRTKDGRMNPFKRGAAHIAIETRVPIVPIRIVGAFEIYPPHRSFPRFFDLDRRRRYDLRVIFGKPLYPNTAAPRVEEEIRLTELLYQVIRSLA